MLYRRLGILDVKIITEFFYKFVVIHGKQFGLPVPSKIDDKKSAENPLGFSGYTAFPHELATKIFFSRSISLIILCKNATSTSQVSAAVTRTWRKS